MSLRRLDDELRVEFVPEAMERSELGLLMASGAWASFRRLWMLAAFAEHGNEVLRSAALAAVDDAGPGGWPQSLRALARDGVPLTAQGRVLSWGRDECLRKASVSRDPQEQVHLFRMVDPGIRHEVMMSRGVSRELVMEVIALPVERYGWVTDSFRLFLRNPSVLPHASVVGEWLSVVRGSDSDGVRDRVSMIAGSPLAGTPEVGLVLLEVVDAFGDVMEMASSGGVLSDVMFDALFSLRAVAGVPLTVVDVSRLHAALSARDDSREERLLRLLRAARERSDEGLFVRVAGRSRLPDEVSRALLGWGTARVREELFLNKFSGVGEDAVRLGLGDADARVRVAAATRLAAFTIPNAGLVRDFLALGEDGVSRALAAYLPSDRASVVLGGDSAEPVRRVLGNVGDLSEGFFLELMASPHWNALGVRALVVARADCPAVVLRAVILGGGELAFKAVRHEAAVGLLGWAGSLRDPFVLAGVASVTSDRGVFERLLRHKSAQVRLWALSNRALLRLEDVRGLLAEKSVRGKSALLRRLFLEEERLLRRIQSS